MILVGCQMNIDLELQGSKAPRDPSSCAAISNSQHGQKDLEGMFTNFRLPHSQPQWCEFLFQG